MKLMRQIIVLTVLLAAGAGLLAGALLLGGPKPNARPNVVLIVIDTLRADRIHAERNGVPVMPRLAALASEGRLFTNAISPASWTRPAVSSLFSGQYVGTHGVIYGLSKDTEGKMFAHNMHRRWPLIAETLSDAGYDTSAVVTNGHLQPGTDFEQGVPPARYLYESDIPAERVNELSAPLLRGVREPFFHYLHYMDPHAPYVAPEPFVSDFGPLPALSESDQAALDPKNHILVISDRALVQLGQRREPEFAPLSEAGREAYRHQYDAECRYVDEHVADLIERIRTRHPDTLFIITADHGEEFWEHEGLGHGLTLYQEQIHVPLIAVGPTVPPGVVDQPVETVGIYKTILAYLGIAEPLPLRGANLLAEAPGSQAFTMTRGPSLDFPVDLDATLNGSTKAIRNNADGQTRLYNLAADPAEQQPAPDTDGTWSAALDAHAKESQRIRPPQIQAVEKTVDPAHQKLMEELGYAEEKE